MALALDEPNELDEVYNFDKLQFVINKELLTEVAPIKLDYTIYGFILDSNMRSAGCGSCGGSCSTDH